MLLNIPTCLNGLELSTLGLLGGKFNESVSERADLWVPFKGCETVQQQVWEVNNAFSAGVIDIRLHECFKYTK